MGANKRFSEEILTEICNTYLNGDGIYLVGKKYGVCAQSISNILHSRNIQIRGNARKQSVTSNPFEDLTSPEVQYWLGWIVTDGNLHDKRIVLNTTLKDLDIAKKYCKFLNIDDSYIKYREHPKNSNWDIAVYVRFGHKPTFDYLKSLAITECKSMTINPNIEFTDAFIRGVLEGNGYFSSTRKSISIVLSSSSLPFIDKYLKYLSDRNIKSYTYEYKKSIHWTVRVSSKETIKLINHIYPQNCEIYGERKFKKAKEIIEYYEQK